MATISEMKLQLEQQAARILELEAENHRLRNPPRESADVPYSEIEESFRLPSSRQMIALWDIVRRTVPALGRDPQADYQNFAHAIWWLGSSGRIEATETLASRVYLTSWLDLARQWLVSAGRSGDIGAVNLLLACCALRIKYMPANTLMGVVAQVALVEGHRSGDKVNGVWITPPSYPIRNAWLTTLQTSQGLEPTLPPPGPTPSPARVIQANIPTAVREREGLY